MRRILSPHPHFMTERHLNPYAGTQKDDLEETPEQRDAQPHAESGHDEPDRTHDEQGSPASVSCFLPTPFRLRSMLPAGRQHIWWSQPERDAHAHREDHDIVEPSHYWEKARDELNRAEGIGESQCGD